MKNILRVKFQYGALTNFLYAYCVLCTLIFILIIFDAITYKDSNNIYKRFSEN